MRLVQDHVARLVGRDKPAPVVFLSKLSRELREQTGRHHIRVEGRLGLFFRQTSLQCLGSEIIFNLLTDGVTYKLSGYDRILHSPVQHTILKINQTSTINLNITNRHPSSHSRRLSIAKEDLIIVDTNGLRTRDIVSQERPLEGQSIVTPAGELGDKIVQSGVVNHVLSVPVLVMGLDGLVDKLCRAVSTRAAIAAHMAGSNAGIIVDGLRPVKDSLHRLGALLQNASRSEVLEIGLAGFQDIFAGQHLLQEEVAVLIVALAEFLDGEVRVGGAQVRCVLRGQGTIADGQGSLG